MGKQWFVLRVKAGREETVRESLWKRVQTHDLTDKLAQLLVVCERVTEIKGGNRRSYERKIYPGYIMAEIEVDETGEIPEDIWFLIRETPGIGDFVGSQRKPIPMTPDEVQKMLDQVKRSQAEPDQVTIEFQKGAQVKIREGTFENYEGEVEDVDVQKGLVKVLVTIFGRKTPIELEYWKVESVET